ncbi:ATP-binding protein [Campylobacter sp. CCUG 57310]|uniref:ATP-binding protein n=1 Tax=Campylobacter sp. CCUG 57310 TaxID=2517362 RepID=UPI0015633634|nr:ATP-binding protein [Campylobacter sp. CCUG 57310]QKF91266.1 ATP-binding protein (AAA domain) [Campylobacter sp. CCUG 57310]
MLENIYQAPIKSVKFIDRKFSISSPKTLIIGASGSGKTSLLIDYLKSFKNEERLYINLYDIRVNSSEILENLPNFLTANKQIKALAIDNISSDEQARKLAEILRENLENITLATQKRDINLPNFTTLNLNLLDYEEFIAFFPKNLDQDQLFSHFVTHGNNLNSVFLDQSEVVENLQSRLKSKLSEVEINLLKECAAFQGVNLSAYELYKNLKTRSKISKDRVYAGLVDLENRGFINLIAKFDQPTAAKKLYFSDFAMRNALSLKKDFAKLFSNMVFCELFKFKEEIFYTKDFDFFLSKRKLAILCIPFSDSDLIFLKFKKLHASLKALGVNKLQVISVANQADLSIEGIKCEILPFSRWALSF